MLLKLQKIIFDFFYKKASLKLNSKFPKNVYNMTTKYIYTTYKTLNINSIYKKYRHAMKKKKINLIKKIKS